MPLQDVFEGRHALYLYTVQVPPVKLSWV
jgi:hypothetical protein